MKGDFSINYKCMKCTTTFTISSASNEIILAKNFDHKCKLQNHIQIEREYSSLLDIDEYNLVISKIKEGTNLINKYLHKSDSLK